MGLSLASAGKCAVQYRTRPALPPPRTCTRGCVCERERGVEGGGAMFANVATFRPS